MEMKLQNDLLTKAVNNIDLINKYISSEDRISVLWLGRQPYNVVWELQKKLHLQRTQSKIGDTILFVEHDHVYTFGKNADKNYLLETDINNVDVIQIDRGGEVTYHGPGQLVCYPILNLHDYKLSISWYMRSLEEVIIRYLKQYQINAHRKQGYTGVWIYDQKICALGVRLSKWVTMHGFALNIKPDMHYFDRIIPCGIFEYGVTSLNNFGILDTMENIIDSIMVHFNDVFIGYNSEV